MPYQIDWAVPDKVIYLRCWGVVTPDEVIGFNREINAMVAPYDDLVHTLANILAVEQVQGGLADIRKSMNETNDNAGWIITISDSRLLRFFAQMTAHFSKSKSKQFATLTEGLDYLAKIDSRLPDADAMQTRIDNLPTLPDA